MASATRRTTVRSPLKLTVENHEPSALLPETVASRTSTVSSVPIMSWCLCLVARRRRQAPQPAGRRVSLTRFCLCTCLPEVNAFSGAHKRVERRCVMRRCRGALRACIRATGDRLLSGLYGPSVSAQANDHAANWGLRNKCLPEGRTLCAPMGRVREDARVQYYN